MHRVSIASFRGNGGQRRSRARRMRASRRTTWAFAGTGMHDAQ